MKKLKSTLETLFVADRVKIEESYHHTERLCAWVWFEGYELYFYGYESQIIQQAETKIANFKPNEVSALNARKSGLKIKIELIVGCDDWNNELYIHNVIWGNFDVTQMFQAYPNLYYEAVDASKRNFTTEIDIPLEQKNERFYFWGNDVTKYLTDAEYSQIMEWEFYLLNEKQQEMEAKEYDKALSNLQTKYKYAIHSA